MIYIMISLITRSTVEKHLDTQSLLILCSGKITSECIDMMYINKSVIIHIGLFFLLLNIILWDICNKTVVFLFLFFGGWGLFGKNLVILQLYQKNNNCTWQFWIDLLTKVLNFTTADSKNQSVCTFDDSCLCKKCENIWLYPVILNSCAQRAEILVVFPSPTFPS